MKTRIPKRFGLDPIRDIQVLCPMNRGGVGARSLNIELQAALNPAGERKVERFGWTFAPGDKVMQIENDYDKEVYNGDIGYIDDVDPDAGELVASFDGRSVTYGFGELDTLVPAYAATIHKSQGSEYPAVVIPMLTQHYAMLQRNLLYTGVTRGKRLVVLVGQKKAVAIAVRNVSGRRRWSKLNEWLAGPTRKAKRMNQLICGLSRKSETDPHPGREFEGEKPAAWKGQLDEVGDPSLPRLRRFGDIDAVAALFQSGAAVSRADRFEPELRATGFSACHRTTALGSVSALTWIEPSVSKLHENFGRGRPPTNCFERAVPEGFQRASDIEPSKLPSIKGPGAPQGGERLKVV